MSGMIRAAKDLLQAVVAQRIPAATVVRSAAAESRAIMSRKWPLVSLITDPGRFDDREAKTVRYPDTEAGVLKQRYVRGSRILPVLLRCWAEGEDAEAAFQYLFLWPKPGMRPEPRQRTSG